MIELKAIASQFHSELKMLEKTIELCPEPVWLEASGDSPNRYWHVAYHALFYLHLYLSPTEADFVAAPIHRTEYQFLGAVPWRPNERHIADEPYSQWELRDYAAFCHHEIDKQTAALDLDAPSGFSWLPFNKLELQLYNLRHVAHHTGQLVDRLRARAGVSVGWVR